MPRCTVYLKWENRPVRLILVRGHIRVKRNDRADALAKERASLFTENITLVPTSMAARKGRIRDQQNNAAKRRRNRTGAVPAL